MVAGDEMGTGGVGQGTGDLCDSRCFWGLWLAFDMLRRRRQVPDLACLVGWPPRMMLVILPRLQPTLHMDQECERHQVSHSGACCSIVASWYCSDVG